MSIRLIDLVRGSAAEAEAIIRKCVHCGFCLTTCPTYQLDHNELDSPRGRIYLIKEMLADAPVTEKTQLHLDRCLTCRACETACPSGVEYGRLLDIGREVVERRVARSPLMRLQRLALRKLLLSGPLFAGLLRFGQAVRFLLPPALRRKVPPKRRADLWPPPRHARTMLVLDGCVQQALAPNINAAAAAVLDALGVSLIRTPSATCCGALSQHLSVHEEALQFARGNIDLWWPYIEGGAEAIVMTASGCGAMVTDYGRLLRHDQMYALKAARVSAMTFDIGQVLASESDALRDLFGSRSTAPIRRDVRERLVAFHSPCTLQHGQRLRGLVEPMLIAAGFNLAPTPDAALCCGSAGAYSILQSKHSQRLLRRKVKSLETGDPECIVTANIGCLTHIQSGTKLNVMHWIEIIAQNLSSSVSGARPAQVSESR